MMHLTFKMKTLKLLSFMTMIIEVHLSFLFAMVNSNTCSKSLFLSTVVVLNSMTFWGLSDWGPAHFQKRLVVPKVRFLCKALQLIKENGGLIFELMLTHAFLVYLSWPGHVINLMIFIILCYGNWPKQQGSIISLQGCIFDTID